MNLENKNNKIFEEALKLLPWYASGRLTSTEMSYVDDALKVFPELQDQLKTEYKIRNFLNEEKELFYFSALESSEERLKAVFNHEVFNGKSALADDVAKSQKQTSEVKGFIQSFLSGRMTKAQYMGFASIVTLSVALLFAFVEPLVNPKNTFHPAYIGTSQSNDTSILVGLSVAPDDSRLVGILGKFQTRTVEVAGKKGMYRISFTEKPSPQDLKKLLKKLSEDEKLIWFVGESY
ncbi:MAG: hypothetical protein L3J51_09550 [Cocleimonas sp.]|nr:hypothetical protein [Cocleimonas sp.]